ncbi:MAG: hypothetical protein ACRDTT_02600 [Pseudonocardiaceae bacterium]
MTANDGVGRGSGGGFLRWVELADGPGFDPARYPFPCPSYARYADTGWTCTRL